MDSKNFQLLSMIENIDMVTEYAEYNVLSAMYNEYEKFGFMLEKSTDIAEDPNIALIMEGSFGKSVEKGFKAVAKALKKLWGMIVSFFKMCKKALSKIFKRLKRDTHGAKKTVNQILHDMEKSGKKIKKKVKKVFHEAADVSEVRRIQIPANDLSDDEYKNQEVVYPTKAWSNDGPRIDVIIRDDGSQAVSITGLESEIAGNVNIQESEQSTSSSSGSVSNISKDTRNNSNARIDEWNFTEFFAFIAAANNVAKFNKEIRSVIDTTIEILKSSGSMGKDIPKFQEEMEDVFKEYKTTQLKAMNEVKPTINFKEIIISMDDFNKVQTVVDTCMDGMKTVPELCNILDNLEKDALYEQKYRLCTSLIEKLNRYLSTFFHMQMLMNKIAAQFITDEMQLPDPDYFGAFDSFELFDDLVSSLIESHIPQKFVMYSAWLLSADNIRGNGEEYKPIWGQSRGCFFPVNEDFIYKFALSGRSITDNKTEVGISKLLKSKGVSNVVAEIYENSPSYCVMKMQKLYNIGTMPINSDEDSKMINHYFRKICNQHNIPFYFTDLHKKNLGFKSPNGKPVMTDNGTYATNEDGTYKTTEPPIILDYAMIKNE